MARPISDKGVYQLTDGDKAIIREVFQTGNLNLFTDWYLRNEKTGTRFNPVEPYLKLDEDYRPVLDMWRENYRKLHKKWLRSGKPGEFDYNGKHYVVESDFTRPDRPTFFLNHGFLFQKWQMDFINGPEPTKVLIGGFGSGKTLLGAVYMLFCAATMPGFRGFALAPYSIQALEVYKAIISLIDGTLYKERFFAGAPMKPFPRIIIRNDYVRESTIEMYSIMDDPNKILTLTGDMAMIDQAEQLPDIDLITENVGSRFRGQIHGRERKGYLWFMANSADSSIWDLVDDSDYDDGIGAYFSSTYDNNYITPRQMKLIEDRVIKGDPDNKRVKLQGGRPIGGGIHFPPSSMKRARSEYLDDLMARGIEEERKLEERNGGILPEGYEQKYIIHKSRRVEIHHWEIPKQEDGNYWVFADPGWGNPPYRNAAVVIAVNIKGFPERPAEVHAFSWVFGRGSPEPWMEQYYNWVNKYDARGQNGFDATGLQAGYAMWVNAINNLFPVEIKLGGENKFKYLNHLKMMLSRGMILIPSIPGIFDQFSKYRLPDTQVRQDIVMTFCLMAGTLMPMMYDALDMSDDEQNDIGDIVSGRYERELEDRYERDLDLATPGSIEYEEMMRTIEAQNRMKYIANSKPPERKTNNSWWKEEYY